MDDKELISALADGQVDGQQMARGLDALASSPEARRCWSHYHLIGDVLRSPELAAESPADAFVQRLAQRLALEPVPSSSQASQAVPAQLEPMPQMAPRAAPRQDKAAANDGRYAWPWKLAAGFASLAGVSVVAWMAMGALSPAGGPTGPARLASESMPPRVGMVVTATEKGPMLRDPALDEMLATHRQLGGVTALQPPAAGLHNATFEASVR